MAEEPESSSTTLFLKKRPITLPLSKTDGLDQFDADAHVMLQLLPSGTCLAVAVDSAVILGRQVPMPPALLEQREVYVDLTPHRAYQHGISRRHCLLKRRGNHLILTDLAGANGTYCNGERLLAFQEYIVSSGDELILGTLRMRITFERGALPAAEDEE